MEGRTSLNGENQRVDLGAMPDHELMSRLKNASREERAAGFEVLVRRYKNGVVTFLYRFVGDYRAAEDLAQEAFLRVFRKLDEYNHSAKFSTWLYTIASNLAKDRLEQDETRLQVNEALKQLKEDDREILVLKDVQGMAYEDIAEILGLPMGTVKSRISRARLAFKEVWKKMG